MTMKTMEFKIEIDASRERVWKTLWEDTTFRDWSGVIDEGTYMKGELKEGNKVEFISLVNGYGVTSLVEKLQPEEFVAFRHRADTIESGQQTREKEWTGGVESYHLADNNGKVILTVKTDVPKEQESLFNVRMPKALKRIKALAEYHK